jgi:hypothetical protein
LGLDVQRISRFALYIGKQHLKNSQEFKQGDRTMSFQTKKAYVAPELAVYGNVEKLTQKNGSQFNDTPFGTPATDNDNGNASFFK